MDNKKAYKVSCKLYHKSTRFETEYLYAQIQRKCVANYTTNQLGLKQKNTHSQNQPLLVANYTTNQLGLKHND